MANMLVHIPQEIVIFVLLLATFSVELSLQCGWKEKLEKLQQCCTVPKVEMADESVISGCTASMANRTQANNERKQEHCITECVFLESKYIDANGDLNVDAITQNFRRNLPGDNQWVEAFINATTMCLDNKNKKIAERLKKMAEKFKDKPNHCNPVPKQLIQCTQNMVYWNCPESARNSSAECVAVHSELDKHRNGKHGKREGRKNGRKEKEEEKNPMKEIESTTEEEFRGTTIGDTSNI